MRWALAAALALVLGGAIVFSLLEPAAPASTADHAVPAPPPAAPSAPLRPQDGAAPATSAAASAPPPARAAPPPSEWRERWKDVAPQPPPRARERSSPLSRAVTNAVRYEIADCTAALPEHTRPRTIDAELFIETLDEVYRVVHADVAGELDPVVRACIERAFEKDLSLPGPRAGQRLRVPFSLAVPEPL